MERRKKMTKSLISESLKILMQTHPFEKITIRMITDASGVIRPTFYNYFCDKYEVLEWIFEDEVIARVRPLFDQKMYVEGIKMIFVSISGERKFYQRAFEVLGQNSFNESVLGHLHDLFLTVFSGSRAGQDIHSQVISPSLIARQYALMLLDMLREFTGGIYSQAQAEEMTEAYIYILEHRASDYLSMI